MEASTASSQLWNLEDLQAAYKSKDSLHFSPEPEYLTTDYSRFGNLPLGNPFSETLQHDEMRLLRLLPARFSSKEGLACIVSTFNLGSNKRRPAPPYVALSYCWGDYAAAEEEFDIECCGSHVKQIKGNLAAVLTRLRDLGFWDWLWVDSICINQEDDEEKSLQIPLMGEIFMGSIVTLGWLGEPLVPLSTLWHHSETVKNIYKRSVRKLVDVKAPPFLTSSEPKWPPDIYWSSLSWIFDNLFFQRVWTLQEAIIPERLFLLAGSTLLDWDEVHLVAGCAMLLDLMGPTAIGLDTTQAQRHAQQQATALNYLGELRTLFRTGYPRDALIYVSSVVQHSQARSATKPSDHVFGILGLLDDRSQAALTVDVRRSSESTFVDFMIGLFSIHGAAMCDQLRRAGLRGTGDRDAESTGIGDFDEGKERREAATGKERPIEILPSWCTDFSQAAVTESLRTIAVSTYKVAGTRELSALQNIIIDRDRRLLTVRGWRLCEVREATVFHKDASSGHDSPSSTQVEKSQVNAKVFATLELCSAMAFRASAISEEKTLTHDAHDSQGKDGIDQDKEAKQADDFETILATTISAECRLSRTVPGKPAQTRLSAFHEWKTQMEKQSMHIQSAHDNNGINQDKRLGEDEERREVSKTEAMSKSDVLETPLHETSSFDQGVRRACRNRAFFTTTDGRTGLGPRLVRPGDTVCAVFGSNVLLMLRRVESDSGIEENERRGDEKEGREKENSRYKLLGECYCHGLNFGEAPGYAAEKKLHIEEFALE